MRPMIMKSLTIVLVIACVCVVTIRFVTAQDNSHLIGERPALAKHINQVDIENGTIQFKQLLDIGESIFAAWIRACGSEVCTVFGAAEAARFSLDLAGTAIDREVN